jgi:hypothetical protein
LGQHDSVGVMGTCMFINPLEIASVSGAWFTTNPNALGASVSHGLQTLFLSPYENDGSSRESAVSVAALTFASRSCLAVCSSRTKGDEDTCVRYF